MSTLTGADIIERFLAKAGVTHAVAVAGAAAPKSERIRLVSVTGEASARGIAYAYYRVCGRPMAVFAPKATATTAAMMVFTPPSDLRPGSAKAYMRVSGPGDLPQVLHRAWNAMMTGRRGPVVVEIQRTAFEAEAEAEIPDAKDHMPGGRMFGDAAQIDKALRLLKASKRPVILAGGGVIESDATGELKALAEHMGAAVVTTLMGKSAFPESHPLYGWHTGAMGTSCGNRLTAQADVLFAVGCRLCGEVIAPYDGAPSCRVPPTKLVQVDVEPTRIGSVLPVTVGIVGDAKMVLNAMLRKLRETTKPRLYVRMPYFHEITQLKKEWFNHLDAGNQESQVRLTTSVVLGEVRRYLEPEAFVASSHGLAQAAVFQRMAFSLPRTHITACSNAWPGFGIAAAVGAKLAWPDRKSLAVVTPEGVEAAADVLSASIEHRIPIVVVALGKIGKSPGCAVERVESAGDLREALKRAYNLGASAIVEAPVVG